MINKNLDILSVDSALSSEKPDRPYTSCTFNFYFYLLGYYGKRPSKFTVENTGKLVGTFGEIVAAITVIGQLSHQIFVITQSQPDCGYRYAILNQTSSEAT